MKCKVTFKPSIDTKQFKAKRRKWQFVTIVDGASTYFYFQKKIFLSQHNSSSQDKPRWCLTSRYFPKPLPSKSSADSLHLLHFNSIEGTIYCIEHMRFIVGNWTRQCSHRQGNLKICPHLIQNNTFQLIPNH